MVQDTPGLSRTMFLGKISGNFTCGVEVGSDMNM